MPNRLNKETSPYLLQHADNPVDWYPWGEEAFEQARAEDKPIFLSVGYAACHWCHVMAHESFEDAHIAQLMNEKFVNIKVDREERPDVDSIYMQAVQAQTGHGGWPMSVFLTPEGRPFFGGTYFPPRDQRGMTGFPKVLETVARAYRDRKAEVEQSAEQLVSQLSSRVTTPQGQVPLTAEVLSDAYQGLAMEFDREHGGLGPSPKFPQPMALEFLLRYHARTGDPEALAMVDFTLEKMVRGGIYDQLGGGFHRYSTDDLWLVPHFEKMLYDNALLSRLYLHAYQVTCNVEYRRIAEETLDYVLREMTSPDGGFYSTQDADSEGEEGKFFVWTPQEIESVLSREMATVFNRYYGVTDQGNFEGRNILHVALEPGEAAGELNIGEEELAVLMREARMKLLAHRQGRVPPGLDDKVLTAWNGMMLRSMAEASAILNRKDYLDAAVKNASFLLDTLRSADGRVMRSYRNGQAKHKGYLEDYAFLIDGLLALHEVTLDLHWLREASRLAGAMSDLFWDEAEQGFFDTGHDHEALVVRPRNVFENATPSGGSVASDVLLKLAVLTGDGECNRRATASLSGLSTVMARAPIAFGRWLCALDFHLSTLKEIAVVGPLDDARTRALLAEVFARYLPNKVVTGYDPAQSDGFDEYPLLEDKYMVDGVPSVFVCENYACMLPATDVEALAVSLTI
ncbi:MAG: thioredoxin domain-containing protein [Dehalococcoidia bacterium]